MLLDKKVTIKIKNIGYQIILDNLNFKIQSIHSRVDWLVHPFHGWFYAF